MKFNIFRLTYPILFVQEDAHVANIKFLDNPNKALFGVFDGHGGREVAVYCNMHYESILGSSLEIIDTDPKKEEEWLR